MAEPFIGQIMMFGGNFAPSGWALCNGQTLPISSNEALFSILGTTFGGNGANNFQLPNLQCRFPVHPGSPGSLTRIVLGESAGAQAATVLASNLPPHTHTVATPCSNVAATANTPVNAYPAVDSATLTIDPPSVHGSVAVSTFALAPVAGVTMAPYPTGAAGAGIPLPIQPPYLAINFIIALQGIFPSRS